MGFFDKFKNKNKPVEVNKNDNQLEEKKTHARIFKLAGVTFNNRQSNLKKLKTQRDKGKVLNVALEQYDYEGSPAIKITVNGLDVGNLHKKDCDFVLKNQEYVKGINDFYIGTFEDEKNKTVYYGKVKILFYNKK